MSLLWDLNRTIPEIFEGKSVFITGGSGFIGKVLIEKLLRSCPGIKNIYVLVRPKKNKNIQERVEALFDVPLFDQLKADNIAIIKRVIGVEGDITKVNLGMNESDTTIILDNVSIIYHIAASVRFNDFLKSAIFANTRSTREVISLAKQCASLDVFVYCSTAYSNFDQHVIEEKVYPPIHDWRIAIEMAETYDDMTLQVLTEKFINPLPNTYTFTKRMAEQLVIDLCTNQIPAIITRPSIVLPSSNDPIDGWVDNFNGPMSINLLAGKGLVKVIYGDEDSEQDYVFVDNTAKSLVIAAWKKIIQTDKSKIEVYNIASDMNSTNKFMRDEGNKIISKNPPESYLWAADAAFVKSSDVFFIATLIYHLMPAIILDLIMRLTGRKPKFFKIYRMFYVANLALYIFMSKTVDIRCENYVALENSLLKYDRRSFSFIDSRVRPNSTGTKEGYTVFWRGIKQFLLNEKAHATESEIKKYEWVMFLQKMVFLAVKGSIIYFILLRLFSASITSQVNGITDI
ncbi:unnamed protein product [Phaedon cochleariae]|uniref:Fatty acyl-CoA reductase n=1 Tax=Phaedon cochleariae TaxID=80249 RepID=A0A9P0DHV3_PHACE|nr:unnamed protein product [Phaedon cochleariae]